MTTTALGVGRDNIGSEGEAYGQTFHARLNYKVVNQTHWGVSLRLDPILYVEITNSDTTTTERQPEFLDLPLSTLVTYKAYSSGLWSTTPGYVFGLSFPTSRASAANGTILQTSNRLLLTQNVPLLGQDAPVLKSVSFDGVVRWDHRFSKATTPVDDGLDRPRQNLVGGSFLDDQLGGGRFARDTLREVLSVSFSESLGGVPITLGADFLFSQQLKPEFDTSCVQIATGPVCVGDGADAPEELFYYGFGASLAVKPVPEASVTLSYGSSSSPLGQQQVSPDGDRQNFFYTPSAEFGLTVFFYPDALYERIATGTPRALAKRKSKRGAF